MRGTHKTIFHNDEPRRIIPAYAGNTTKPPQYNLYCWDHPRVCGEHMTGSGVCVPSRGSSPRMRGTRADAALGVNQLGIIPAYAGNTDTIGLTPQGLRDHPRVCGEHPRLEPSLSAAEGSSPRMRGTPRSRSMARRRSGIIPAYAGNTCSRRSRFMCARDHPRVCGEHQLPVIEPVQVVGIIPAYAGNTSTCRCIVTNLRDHPRVCGEHSMLKAAANASTGSSPRMRGTPGQYAVLGDGRGIIPAYAGNTGRFLPRPHHRRDHPRVCGEHSKVLLIRSNCSGSSPRMRGTPFRYGLRVDLRGIIPAYAGNTMSLKKVSLRCWDHPRVCGEHHTLGTSGSQSQGSSPRMRGTLGFPVVFPCIFGIIPAYAGNTDHGTLYRVGAKDHPRVCGEHHDLRMVPETVTGSSPRMRGTRAERDLAELQGGIIPAYAGNTPQPPCSRRRCRDHPRVCGEHVRSGEIPVPSAGSSPRMRGTLLRTAA